MKVRIGIGLGAAATAFGGEAFGRIVDDAEHLGFDSLWVSEHAGGESLDPLVAMTFAAARTSKLKFGPSVMVLPGRNPVILAKALASLDRISDGRLLPAFGLGVADGAEQQAFGVSRQERAGWFNEALPLIRRLWSEDTVTHHGTRFHLDEVNIGPKPVQQPMDVWLGGIAPSELRRVGRLSDGWLPSFVTPEDVSEGIATVQQHAAEAGRSIDPEHFGVLLAYAHGPLPDRFGAVLERRQPGKNPADLIAFERGLIRERIEAHTQAGASKFVVMPLGAPDDWDKELQALAEDLLDLQT